MPWPIDDDGDATRGRERREEWSFSVWLLAGGALVLLYVLAVILLSPP